MPVLKATPRFDNTGYDDQSRVPLAIEPEALPQHLPLVPLLTKRGPEEPQVVIGDGFSQMYAAESLDLLSEFATHQTVLAKAVMQRGNKIMVKRLRPTDGKTAILRYSLEIIEAMIVQYERNADGTYQLDIDGAPIPVTDGDGGLIRELGKRLVWHVGFQGAAGVDGINHTFSNAIVISDFRNGSVEFNGEQLSDVYVVESSSVFVSSTLYPILDLEVNDFGNWGNNVGFGLFPANATHSQPGDVPLMRTLKTFLYRVFCGERESATATPIIVDTISGDKTQDLSFKDNVVNPTTKKSVNFGKRFIPAYQTLNDSNVQPLYGLFGQSYLYKDNFELVIELLANDGNGEGFYDADALPFGRTPDVAFTDRPDNYQLLNIFTGVDQNGVPYFSFDVANSVKFGGVAFGPNNLHYATGGDDGLAYRADGRPDTLQNLSIYDSLVNTELKNLGDLDTKWLDELRYPYSTIWDSGFSIDTKKQFLVAMARRKDTYVVLATHRVADYDNPAEPLLAEWRMKAQNTGTEESDIAALLSSAALNYPESEVYGTPVCRVAIVGHSGYLLESQYDGLLPITIDVADKVANYMGASTGVWRPGFAFNKKENNRVTLFRDINLTYKKPTVYNRDWDNGLIWVQSSDRRNWYYPAFQTAYPDDTSVLNSLATVQACCELTKVGKTVHRDIGGDDTLTDLQFIEESDRLISERSKPSRFDNRFVITPETLLREIDIETGFTWRTLIHLYANSMRTVNTFTVVTHRMSSLTGA